MTTSNDAEQRMSPKTNADAGYRPLDSLASPPQEDESSRSKDEVNNRVLEMFSGLEDEFDELTKKNVGTLNTCTKPVRMKLIKFSKSRWCGCLLGPLFGVFLYFYITHLCLKGRPFTSTYSDHTKNEAENETQIEVLDWEPWLTTKQR